MELKENIAENIAQQVKNCYSNQKFSTVTIKDVKEIVSKEIDAYAQVKDLDIILLTKKLIIELDSHFKYLNEDLANEAIYNTDFQITDLEHDEEHFFSKESLLSESPEYNKKLRAKVAKARLLGKKYISDPDQGIYIVRKEISELDLSDDEAIKKLDFRRLRSCRSLNKIILGSHLNSISYLDEVAIYNSKIKIYYDPDIIQRDVIKHICDFQNSHEDDFKRIFIL